MSRVLHIAMVTGYINFPHAQMIEVCQELPAWTGPYTWEQTVFQAYLSHTQSGLETLKWDLGADIKGFTVLLCLDC